MALQKLERGLSSAACPHAPAPPTKWTTSTSDCDWLRSLATSAPLLHDVWAKARDAELTRFTTLAGKEIRTRHNGN